MEVETILENYSKSRSKDFCKLLQENKNCKNVYREEGGIEFDKLPGGVEDYRLTKKKEEEVNKKLALSSRNQNLANKVEKSRGQLLGFDGKSLCSSAMADK